MLAREMRMVDMQIMASLQNGTAFFASTSLIAIGGALTLIRSTDEIQSVVAALPFGIQATRGLWEAKTIGLVVVFAYAFFKFAWSYRLYAYVAILLGAMPFPAEKDTPEAEAHVLRTARLQGLGVSVTPVTRARLQAASISTVTIAMTGFKNRIEFSVLILVNRKLLAAYSSRNFPRIRYYVTDGRQGA